MSGERATIYEQCGLRWRSTIPLHLPPATGSDWDVEITVGPPFDGGDRRPPGEVVAQLVEDDGAWWYCVTSNPDRYVVRLFERCDFVISPDVSRVEVRSTAEFTELVPVMLTGTVLSIVLGLRGHTVLHASAATLDDVAVAFVTQSGGGKSTTAALLCLDGGRLVTDDVLVVQPGPPVTCIGGAAELRLREAARGIAADRSDLARRTTADERMALSVHPAAATPHRLAAILIPLPSRTATTVEAEQLTAADALFMLLATPRVFGWRDEAVLARDFGVIAQIVDQIPVYRVTIPWGPPFSPTIAPALRSLVLDGSLAG